MAFGLNFDIMSNFSSEGFDEANEAMSDLENMSQELGLSQSELQNRIETMDDAMVTSSGAIRNAKGQFTDLNQVMDEAGSEQIALATAADEMGESQEFIQEQLSRTNTVMHTNAQGAAQFRDMTTGSFKDARKASETMSDQLQTFEFDMLSVMFAGMALSRTMQDLTNPAMESAGIFELISDTLEIFFLPIALAILPVLNDILGWFRSAPKPVKMIVGVLGVLAIVIGKVASFAGILILNWSTIVGVLGTVAGAVTSFGSIVAGAFTTLGSLVVGAISTIVGAISLPIVAIAAVIAAIVGFALAWKDNLFGIRQKVGKFVQFVGKHFKTIAKIMFLPLEPLNQIIKAINKLTGKSLPTVDDVLSDVGDSIEEMGKGFEESGEKMDKMKEKAPDKKKQGFIDRFMPDIGGKKSEAKGSGSGQGQTQNNFNNKFEIKGASEMDESELARKIGRRQKEVQDKTVRTR